MYLEHVHRESLKEIRTDENVNWRSIPHKFEHIAFTEVKCSLLLNGDRGPNVLVYCKMVGVH